ncbi:phage tail tape measure protein [Antarctobacter heliothermus]|uniref:Phage tail tape measure protein, TP901 family, core region n=1 Tax=Antarctobacter heliothermus TaxID=74033 RepID=A0A239EK42_9RHOB|nr:phage tail tape measure protein [Antarctobacter heliothermus]SNS44272.1 phage tail tape measure protein, TP901 family, core region [Antarctobacter heliothermus]
MSDLNIAMILRLVDRVSAPARQVRGALSGIAESATRAGNRTAAFADRSIAAAQASRTAMRGAAMGTVGMGFALFQAMRPAVRFEEAMAGVGAVSGASQEELERLTEEARRLGSTTPHAASAAADGMRFLAQAGFDVNETIEAMPGLLNLASAAQTSLADTSDITSNILSGFRMEADEMGRLGDVLTNTFTSSNVDLRMLGTTMEFVAPAAEAAGVSLEQTAAMAGLLGDAGIQGSKAGTGLRAVIDRLSSASGEGQAALEALGVQTSDANGNLRDMPTLLAEIDAAMADLGSAERAGMRSAIFGREASSAAEILLERAGAGRLDEYAESLHRAGTAAGIAAQMNDNAQGSLRRLASVAESASIAAGNALLPALTDVAEGIAPIVEMAAAWADANPELIAQIGTFTAGLLGLRVASLVLRYAALTTAVPVLRLIGAGGRLVAFLPVLGRALLALLNPFALVRGAMIALRVALLASGIGAIVAGIALAGLWIWNNWEGLLAFFQGFGVGLRAALGPAAPLLDWLVERAQALAEWIGALVAPLDASAEAWAEWGETAGGWLGGVVAQLIEWIEASPAVAQGVALVTAGVMGLRLALRVATWPLRMFGRLLGSVVGGMARLSGLRALRLSRLLTPLRWVALIPRLIWSLFLTLAVGGRRLLVSGLFKALAWGALIPRLARATWVALAVGSRLAVSALFRPLSWAASALIPRLSALRFRSIATGGARLAVSALVAPLRWTRRLIPAIRWGSLGLGVLGMTRGGWGALVRPLVWAARIGGRALIGPIGWALLAGELLWSFLIKPVGWDEYLSREALSGYVEEIRKWFTWENLIEVINWAVWLPIAPFTALMEWIFGFQWSDFLPDWSWSFIGKIDFGDLITWPEPPAWLLWLMGRDDSPIVEAPVVADMPGFNRLTPEVRQAAETVQAAAGRSALPAQRIAELREEAEATRAEIAALEDQLTGPMGPGDMMASAERRRRLGQAQAELEALVGQIAEAEAQSDQLEAALAVLSDTEAAPEINVTSIERALERVRELSGALRNLPGGTANGAAPTGTTSGEPRPAGARALGGSVRPGFGYRINEQGEEIFVPDVAGRVIPARVSRMIMAASMAGVPAVAAAGAVDMAALASFNPAAIAAEMPNIDRSPSLVGAGGNQQVGGVTVGDIHIHAAPGMSPQDIAAEVRREIERIGRESGSANGLHDGGQYDRD